MEEIGTQEAGEEAKEAVSRKPRKKARKVIAMAPKKTHHTAPKDAIAVDPEVAKGIRKLRAHLELKTGDRVTMSDAVAHALSKCSLK